MQLPLKVSVFLILGLLSPLRVSLSAPPEDLEGSGYDLDGSGSGDGSDLASPGEIKSIKLDPDIKQGSSGLTSDSTYWLTEVDVSEPFVSSNKFFFLRNPDILAGLIVGGVAGAIIGAVLAAVLIYRQIKRDEERRQKMAAYENYHKPIREEAFV